MGYSCKLGPAAGKASIVVLAKDGAPFLQELESLPDTASILFQGASVDEMTTPEAKEALGEANVLFYAAPGASDLLRQLLPLAPNVTWIHCLFAGVDSLLFPELARNDRVHLTNARGLFSSSLGEHCVLSCLYFAKDVDRWKRQQRERKWEKFIVSEIKGATLGVVGYGDIGQTAARKARALGMKIIAQRRRPELSSGDGVADEVLGADQVGDVIEKSDYILVAAALTPESKGMVGAKELARARPHAVIINVGRGPLIDEEAMASMLKDGRLRGAALDVFCTEPLPQESPLWDMENVLLSPHNTDMTATFLNDSARSFADNVCNFISGEEVSIHLVDKRAGY